MTYTSSSSARPLRFRVWDIKSHCWIAIETFVGAGYVDLDESLDGTILTQFTGLIDSKGVDIYEGDIVVYDTGDQQENELYAKLLTSEVTWDKDRWRISYAADFYRWRKMTIIGNVFETPDKLTS